MTTVATDGIAALVERVPRCRLATLPTPLERGPELAGGARLWVKRDDLTGLGVGGNKARKLEFLCAEALAAGARSLVTVGAAQSNHCRMTAAAGAVIGLDVHLVMSGDRPDRYEGNQLLSMLFGAQLHFAECPPHHWGELEIAREHVAATLQADGAAPHSIPIGGSTATGALGYVLAYVEMLDQFTAVGLTPAAIVHTSSSGGTHAGLVAGRALARSLGLPGTDSDPPSILAVGVAKGVLAGHPDIATMAAEVIELLGYDEATSRDMIEPSDVDIDDRWLGTDYSMPTAAGDAAITWAATHGGWVLDRTYTGKGLAGLLGNAGDGRWGAGDDVVFIHTGGLPSVFTADGSA